MTDKAKKRLEQEPGVLPAFAGARNAQKNLLRIFVLLIGRGGSYGEAFIASETNSHATALEMQRRLAPEHKNKFLK